MNKESLTEECRKLHPEYDEPQIKDWVKFTMRTHPANKSWLSRLDYVMVWRIAVILCLLGIIIKTHC